MSASRQPSPHEPIIIVGAPRSGTTNLGRTLSAHPDLHYAEEPRLVWKYGNDRKSDLLRPTDAREPVVAYIRQTFQQMVADAGKQRLLEKTPSTGLRMDFVDQVLPDCKFVHIIRNGYESVLAIRRFWEQKAHGLTGLAPGRVSQRFKEISLRRLPYYSREILRRSLPRAMAGVVGHNVWGPRLPGIDGMLREMDVLDVCCLQWRMCVELAVHYGRTLPSERYMELRLEEFSPDTVRSILRHCNLSEQPAVLEQATTRYDPERARRRLREADPADLERIRTWIEPTMHWLGYDPTP